MLLDCEPLERRAPDRLQHPLPCISPAPGKKAKALSTGAHSPFWTVTLRTGEHATLCRAVTCSVGTQLAPCFSLERGWARTAGRSENVYLALDGAQGCPWKAVGSKTGPSPGGLRSLDLKDILETLLSLGEKSL